MSEPIWNRFLTERDKAVFAAGGFGARAGFGRRPALLVIDVNWAFCGERPEPILESIKRWRTSCGEDAWVALDYIKRYLDLRFPSLVKDVRKQVGVDGCRAKRSPLSPPG